MRGGHPEGDTLGFGPTTPGRAGPEDPPLVGDLDFDRTLRGLRGGLPVFGGRFVLEREIGRGGMGVVWLARDLKLDREVAIKFLPEAIANDDLALLDLKRETRRCLELTHPNIVRVHDVRGLTRRRFS
jgi:serine/threonine protein kinase